MTSSFHSWESDPLFSAAEVVQESADRMESIYRLLVHEQSLVLGDHSDSRLLTSIDYHRRDLATILETTKWQLEDFERAVSMSTMMNKSQTNEDVILRHDQFIGAIREQINQVEKSLEDSFGGKSVRNSEWVNLNKQDRDGLALFLSGGSPPEHVSHLDAEDSSSLRRFIDPHTASSSQDDEIVEHGSRDTESLKMNGFVHTDHYCSSEKENNSRHMGSHYFTGLGLDTLNSLQETSCSRYNADRRWDLEANETTPKSFFHENKLRGRYSGKNIFRYLKNQWSAYASGVTRNYMKRLKDGEEKRNSSSHIYVSHAAQGQHMGISMASRDSCLHGFCIGFLANSINLCLRLWAFRLICIRYPYQFQVNQHSVRMILAVIFTLAVLGVLVSQIA